MFVLLTLPVAPPRADAPALLRVLLDGPDAPAAGRMVTSSPGAEVLLPPSRPILLPPRPRRSPGAIVAGLLGVAAPAFTAC